MPSRLETPVLTVDVGLIHKVDTRNVENLFSMWSVFSRCAGSLEEGRRLENLSWRLWNRETFCCDPVSEANATTPAISITPRSPEGHYAADVPELSESIDSCSEEEIMEFDENDDTSSSTSKPVHIARPRVYRQDSLNNSRSRGRERHITPDDLEKMVMTIKERKEIEPLPQSIHSYLVDPITVPIPEVSVISPPPTVIDSVSSDSGSDHSIQVPSSESSCTSERSTTSVVKGFSPPHISSSQRSPGSLIPHLPSSIPTSDIAAADIAAANITSEPTSKKKSPMFILVSSDESSSASERNGFVESQQAQPVTQPKKKSNFYFSSSNEDDSLPERKMQSPSALTAAIQRQPKKQTSFREEVATRIIQEEQPFDDDVFETDDEDEIDESAIDDEDDSSDWEDSNEESGNPSIDENLFKRVDSRPHLTSRPSLITLALTKNATLGAQVAKHPHASQSTSALQRSRTSSPNGPSLAASPDEPLMMKSNLKPISETPTSAPRAQPIVMTTTNTTAHQQALSPRTTRRNMLSTELTVSLRQHLLWERQQKTQTANAVLKRRHTAQDVANLKQYPEKVHMKKEDTEANASWNQYFSQGLGEYHSKGW